MQSPYFSFLAFLFTSALTALAFTACSDNSGPVYPLVSEADASHPSHGLPDGGHVIIHLPRPDAATPDAQTPDADSGQPDATTLLDAASDAQTFSDVGVPPVADASDGG